MVGDLLWPGAAWGADVATVLWLGRAKKSYLIQAEIIQRLFNPL